MPVINWLSWISCLFVVDESLMDILILVEGLNFLGNYYTNCSNWDTGSHCPSNGVPVNSPSMVMIITFTHSLFLLSRKVSFSRNLTSHRFYIIAIFFNHHSRHSHLCSHHFTILFSWICLCMYLFLIITISYNIICMNFQPIWCFHTGETLPSIHFAIHISRNFTSLSCSFSHTTCI